MDFSFGSPSLGANVAPSTHGPGAHLGSDLPEIQTEALGFLAIAGESKVQFLPNAWPADHLPPPTSSLMSIASRKGLIAAAGPDMVVVASTDLIRRSFKQEGAGEGLTKSCQPELKLPMPMRISQLAFSADETYLVLSAENGGGLAVYEVAALLQGSTNSSFELSTNGQALRALVPNPTPEKGELFAVVTFDGNLMMANLKERSFVTGRNGQILKSGVSCISWSVRGKQLVAGLGDGTASQMTPEGEIKADIPGPPNSESKAHVSSVTWLENNVFLVVHTSSSFDKESAPHSDFHIITRTPASASFNFQKITDPIGNFGLNRSPPHHFMLRLKDYPPNLQDIIIVAGSAATDIGLFTRSKVPLAADKDAAQITEVFTMTEMSDDSRRAQLPIANSVQDTSPIGIALDLSSKETVRQPIKSDEELEDSKTPLPALMVLNNEGVLSAWWVIYTDAVRRGEWYPGLVGAPSSTITQLSTIAKPQTSAFGVGNAPGLKSTTFGNQTVTSAFGSSRPSSSFSTVSAPAAAGAFGAPSGLGQPKSVWGAIPSSATASSTNPPFGVSATSSDTAAPNSSTPFSKPAFGFPAPAFGSTAQPSFGSSGIPGNRTSPWANNTSKASAFGQAMSPGVTTSVFGTASTGTGTTTSAPSGFASFASGKGFANTTTPAKGSGSVFVTNAANKGTDAFGVGSSSSTIARSVFGSGAETSSKPLASSGFVLNPIFKADLSIKKDSPSQNKEEKDSFFGGGFGSTLGEIAKPPIAATAISRETDMDAPETKKDEKVENDASVPSTNPASTPAPEKPLFGAVQAPSKSPFRVPAPAVNGLFGNNSNISGDASKSALSTGLSFGQVDVGKPGLTDKDRAGFNNPASATKTSAPTSEQSLAAILQPHASPKIKTEEQSTRPDLTSRVTEPPLPPVSTTKDAYTAGDTSNSSIEIDAPLPPDFLDKTTHQLDSNGTPVPRVSKDRPITADMIPPSDVPGGPEDHEDSDLGLEEEDEDASSQAQHEAVEEDEVEDSSDEGSGEDIAENLSPVSESHQTPAITPEDSFGGLHSRPFDSGHFDNSNQPALSNRASLFGEIGRTAPLLPPPKSQLSPRSPSPIRSAIPGRILRPETSRSVSAPGIASQILGSQSATAKLGDRPLAYITSEAEQRVLEQRRVEQKAQREADESRALVDDEDERMQKHLASSISGTKTLDEFVVHSEYVSKSSKESIPYQIEVVYRDINAMIDTLGLNARSLQAFVKGHMEQYKDEARSREDLEDDEDWCLDEIGSFSSVLEKDLTETLSDGKVTDKPRKLAACQDLQKDIVRYRAKHDDIKRLIDSRRDFDQVAIARAQPLSAEQVAQQHDLRENFMRFQTLLAEAEVALTTLKAQIVSQFASTSKSKGTTGPTVEAVIKTITKMTSMAEKRSGDIDVLEGQLRRLRFSSSVTTDSRDGTTFATPQKQHVSVRDPNAPGTYGLFYTPDSAKDNRRDLRNSFMSSIGSRGPSSPPRKKLSGYSVEEKAHLKASIVRKREVTAKLKISLMKSGAQVRLIENE